MAGETLDAICWRVLGRTQGVTELAYALNPGLAAAGPQLAEGTQVLLPEITESAPAMRETIQLWD
ncbi:phage tail protein [Sphingomonas ursincola]|uniref:Phage tail protein n=1 Tax=Sphingomonas ursincola TaxID=56361 RepID=A0A7V8RB52_9SPHN|nr:tail protein X [Sphingomonas ursincola]MBA1373212.1 phage tail protein [Sphingomonas ursincola]